MSQSNKLSQTLAAQTILVSIGSTHCCFLSFRGIGHDISNTRLEILTCIRDKDGQWLYLSFTLIRFDALNKTFKHLVS